MMPECLAPCRLLDTCAQRPSARGPGPSAAPIITRTGAFSCAGRQLHVRMLLAAWIGPLCSSARLQDALRSSLRKGPTCWTLERAIALIKKACPGKAS
jgi:hypothetical protein